MYEKVKDFPGVVDFIKELGSSENMHNEMAINDEKRAKELVENNFIEDIGELNIDKYFLSNKIKFSTTDTRKFADSEKAINIPKDTDGMFDLIPTIMPQAGGAKDWVSMNYAGATNLEVNDFYDMKNSLTYDRGVTNVVIDSVNLNYFTDEKYIEGVECQVIHEGILLFEKNLDVIDNALSYYTTATSNKIITEGEINFEPIVTSATSTEQPSKLTSVLNTPYFINALVQGSREERLLEYSGSYNTAAYLFLNSLPLPTFREKVLIKEENVRFGAYMSQIFNQVGAIHKIPTALALKIGSIWWRYKNSVINGNDPLSDIWDNIGKITGGTGTVVDAYDSISLNSEYTFNTGTTSYISQSGNSTSVGVYPNYISELHHLVSGVPGNGIPALGGDLDTTIDGSGLVAPLTIHHNSNIKITNGSGSATTTVQFYDVFLDTALKNVDNPLGAKLKDGSYNGRYFVLYPSSGALRDSDVDSYGPVVTGDTATHNGGCRLLWGASNYGYFEHKVSYMPPPNCYSKKIDNTKNKQTDWELNENNDYTTIEELQGVFSVESLDMFENLFKEFSSNKGSDESGGTLKGLISEIMVIENTYVSQIEDPNDVTHLTKELRNAQMNKFEIVMNEFMSKKIHYIHKSTTNLEQDLIDQELTLINIIKSIKNESGDILGKFVDTAHDFTTTPTLPQGNALRSNMILSVGAYSVVNTGYTQFTTHSLANPMYNMFNDIREDGSGIELSYNNITLLSPFIKMYISHLMKTNTVISGNEYIDIFLDKIKKLEERESKFIDTVLTKFGKSFEEEEKGGNNEDMFDSRTSVESDDLKLELYQQFKLLNDRWVSGMELANQTIFERFLFFDRANRNIGDVAYVDIWDIIQLDTPFDKDNGKTLTQSLYSFLSTIVYNNKWQMLALPAYVNFHSMKGNSQALGNSVFSAYRTVDYVDSAPVFLCQYIGKPSENLDKRDVNNGYKDDSSDLNKVTNNILIGGDCGNKEEKNKVVGFNVDFGIPNQNILE